MTTATLITAIRICCIPFFMFFLLSGMPGGEIIALVFFSAAAATDKLDGFVARKYNQVSDLGKLADPLADKLLVLSAFLIFVAQGRMSAVAAVIILTREFAVTSLRVVAIGAGTVMAAGVWGKVKTVVQMTGIIIMLVLPAAKSLIFPALDTALLDVWIVWIMAAVTIWSGVEYFYTHRALLAGRENKK